MPLHPYSPLEGIRVPGDPPPSHPTRAHPFGTDDRGRDILARVVYGFRISLTFAFLVAVGAYTIGILLGAMQGFFGGMVDLFGQRVTEIWAALPFLYVVILISAVLEPSFKMLVLILMAFQWLGIDRYTRAEVLRERQKDYVTAARASGASWARQLFGHVLGNSLTPALTLFPFQLVADIFALTALDFLGFGLAAPTPSWGELFSQGRTDVSSWWLTTFPFAALFLTLLLTTCIGEALREAWDPRDYRLVAPREDRREGRLMSALRRKRRAA
jgi:microcin C transport system permease protein